MTIQITDQGADKSVCVVPYLYVRPIIRHDDDGSYVVTFEWTSDKVDLDRPNTGGIGTGRNLKLAKRLCTATVAGVIFTHGAEVKTDIEGHTYVQASWDVLGRILNADLARKGF